MDMKRLSVVIAASRMKALQRCLVGLNMQDLPKKKYEVVVVVDSYQVKRFGEARLNGATNVRFIVAGNRHPSSKRNMGVQAAAGEILAFIDDDVVVPKKWAATLLQLSSRYRNAIIGGPNRDDRENWKYRCAQALQANAFLEGLKSHKRQQTAIDVGRHDLPLCNLALHRHLFQRIGGFNEGIPYFFDDVEFNCRAEQAGIRLILFPELAVHHELRPLIRDYLLYKLRTRYKIGRYYMNVKYLYRDSLQLRLVHLSWWALPFLVVLWACYPLLLIISIIIYLCASMWTFRGLIQDKAVFWTGPFLLILSHLVCYAGYTAGRLRHFLCGKGKLWRIATLFTHPFPPQDLIIFVTSRCNAQCHFCLFHNQVHDRSRKNRELTVVEYREIARNYGKLIKLSLSGGEPFIRKDIPEIVKAFVDYCKPAIIDIPTNGSFVDRIGPAVEKILDYTRESKPIIEIQLSIDGPKEIHDKIRQLPGIYDHVMETYRVLDGIRSREPRLRIKMNLTFCLENENAGLVLTDQFDRFHDFDRLQITFPHGARAEKNTIPWISYHNYLRQSREILRFAKVRRRLDLHSLIFRAVKIIKDDILKQVMRRKDMGARCRAGERILVVDDVGQVYPCEPIWESIGDLRKTGYRVTPILRGKDYMAFKRSRLGRGKCSCTWGNVMLSEVISNPRYYVRILYYLFWFTITKPKGVRFSKSKNVKKALKV